MGRLQLHLLRASIAAVYAMAVFVSVASAQPQRTTIKRAVEVIDDYLNAAAAHPDRRARQTLEVDALAALLMLPGDDRTASLLQRLRSITRDAPPEWHLDETLKEGALGLAVRRGDLAKAKALVDGGAEWKYVTGPTAERLANLDLERALAIVDQVGNDALWDMADKLCRMGRVDMVRSIVEARPDRPWGHTLYAELGMIPQLERTLADVKDPYSGDPEVRIKRLVTAAYILVRNGDLASAQRIAEQVLAVPTPVSLATLFMGPRRAEECEWQLPTPIDRLMRGSILDRASTPLLGGHSYPPDRSVLEMLAWALAARGPDDRSRELLRKLMLIADTEVERVKIDLSEQADLMEQLKDPARAGAAAKRLAAASSGMAARQGIAFAQFIVGEQSDHDWQIPDVSSIVEFAIDFPRAGLVARVLAERDRLEALKRTDPKVFANIWFNLNVIVGKGDFAREALAMNPIAYGLRVSLLAAIATMHRVGMREESRAALDAYVAARPYAHEELGVITLFIVQGRRDDLVQMLRARLNSADGLYRFVAAGILYDMGEQVDVAPRKPTTQPLSPQEIVSDWGERADILAWMGRLDELKSLIQNPPAEFATLSTGEKIEVRSILDGLATVAMARRGYLEEAVHLVSRRPPEGRYISQYGAAVFSVPYLVYEWTVRGHADQ